MDILEHLSDDEVVKLAAQPTPKPMAGEWMLTAPDGRSWTATSPIHCVQAESNSRIPPDIALARIRASLLQERDKVAEDALEPLATFRAAQIEAGIPEEDLMPEDPAQAIAWLLKLVPEWR